MKTNLLVMLALPVAASCGGQFHDPSLTVVSPTADPRAVALSRVPAQATVRLFVPGGRVEGRIAGVDSLAVRLTRGSGADTVPLERIDSAWVRRDRVARGALTGAITLGVLSALAFNWLSHGFCDAARCAHGQATVTGGVLGAISGAGVGALVGVAASGWQRLRWTRRAGP